MLHSIAGRSMAGYGGLLVAKAHIIHHIMRRRMGSGARVTNDDEPTSIDVHHKLGYVFNESDIDYDMLPAEAVAVGPSATDI